MADDTTGSMETVGPPSTTPPGSRRAAALVGVAVVVMAVLGGGAYAAYSWLNGGGAQPADVLPSSTVAVASIDLDPSAGQKIAALKTIRKFPALKDKLGLQADDDLRKWIFDQATNDGDCKDVDFDHDVLPWLGKRAAFGAVDLGGSDPSPVIALQITDHDKAQKGFKAIVDCAHPGEDFGYVVADDYVLASDSTAHARAILAKGASEPLADDPTYQRWTDEAGDAGVLSFYVAPRAKTYVERMLDDLAGSAFGDRTFSDSETGDPFAVAKDALRDFKGLAGVVRFGDGGMELAVASSGLQGANDLTTVGKKVGELPEDTALALGVGFSKEYAKKVASRLSSDALATAEDQMGLRLPDDLQTLLGDGWTLSLGGKAPDSLDQLGGPQDLPAGLVLHGDAEKIKGLITKVEDHLGMHLSDVPVDVTSSGDKVALSTGGYGEELLKPGALHSAAGFRAVVPHADDASAILYVDFDSKWLDVIAKSATDGDRAAAEFEDNTRPLRSLGFSTWQEGDVSHMLLKVATD
jgi:hypothetical protein